METSPSPQSKSPQKRGTLPAIKTANSPRPTAYLKKGDVEKMENIKEKLGQSDELKALRDKYKGKDIVQQYVNRTPLYQRINKDGSSLLNSLARENEMRMLEKREASKPIDYEELRAHQEKVDKLKEERAMNHSQFFTTDTQTPQILERLHSAEPKVNAHKDKVIAKEKMKKMLDFSNKIKEEKLVIPAELLVFKTQNNSYQNQMNEAKKERERKLEYGHKVEKNFLKKMKQKSEKGKNNRSSTQLVAIKSTNDLDKLNKSMEDNNKPKEIKSERLPSALPTIPKPILKNGAKYTTPRNNINFGNAYLLENQRKFNSDMALEKIANASTPNQDQFKEKDEQKQSMPMYKSTQVESLRNAGDNWVKAIEAKFKAIESLETKPKTKSKYLFENSTRNSLPNINTNRDQQPSSRTKPIQRLDTNNDPNYTDPLSGNGTLLHRDDTIDRLRRDDDDIKYNQQSDVLPPVPAKKQFL